MSRRGRPKINNEEILQTILCDKQARQDLFIRLKELKAILAQVELYSESLKEAVESSSEKTGLTKGFISKLVKLDANGKLAQHIQEAEQFKALMEVSYEPETSEEDEDQEDDGRFDRY